MKDIVFHLAVDAEGSPALAVTVAGEVATAEQVDLVLQALNFDPDVKAALERAIDR